MKPIKFYDEKLNWETSTVAPYLKHHKYNLHAASRALGMNRTTLVQMLQKWVENGVEFEGRDHFEQRYPKSMQKLREAEMSGAV